MQQATSFPTYPDFVSDVKKTYSDDYLKAQHAIGVKVRHYRQWDITDLVALHNSYFGNLIFHHLVQLVVEARKEEAAQAAGTLKTRAYAQCDLTDLAPQGMDWKAYAALISEAVESVRAQSFRVTQNLQQLLQQDAQNEHAATEFDPQAALAQLDEARVTLEPSAYEPQRHHA